MAKALYCAACDEDIWSVAFYAAGDHACPTCDEPLAPRPGDAGELERVQDPLARD